MSYDFQYFNEKPSPGCQVNWSNPLSIGLVGCYLFNEGSGGIIKDIAIGNDGNLFGAMWGDESPWGHSITWTGSNNGISLGPSEQVFSQSNPCTVMTAIYLTSDNSSPGDSRILNSNALTIALSQPFLPYFQASGSTSLVAFSAAGTVQLKEWGILGVSWDGSVSSTGVSFYWNSRDISNKQIPPSGGAVDQIGPTNLGVVSTVIGNNNSINREMYGKMAFLYIWKRKLGFEEIRSVNSSPFSFILPNYKDYNFNSMTTTTVFRRTLSGLGTRVGSRQAIGV